MNTSSPFKTPLFSGQFMILAPLTMLLKVHTHVTHSSLIGSNLSRVQQSPHVPYLFSCMFNKIQIIFLLPIGTQSIKGIQEYNYAKTSYKFTK
jgi:hypothetical protein